MIVLDTHAWLWWLSEPHELSMPAIRAIEAHTESGIAVSTISVWEVARLQKQNRIELAMPVDDLLAHCKRLPNLELLPVTPRIAVASVDLEPLHADPADRIIVATARSLGASLVTKDRRLHTFDGVHTVW